MESCPEIMLMTLDGTKNGETRPGPRFMHVVWVASMVLMPPIPEPMATPTLSPSPLASSSPASRTAWIPAIIPYWMNGSIRRASLRSM